VRAFATAFAIASAIALATERDRLLKLIRHATRCRASTRSNAWPILDPACFTGLTAGQCALESVARRVARDDAGIGRPQLEGEQRSHAPRSRGPVHSRPLTKR
jgi:hypothetical protein